MQRALTGWMTINWKILKEMGIPDHLTCVLQNLYVGQEATVKTSHGITDWFKMGKGLCHPVYLICLFIYILSPCLFNLYAKYIMQNAGLDDSQDGIRILEEISTTTDTWMISYMDAAIRAESEEKLKILLIKMKKEIVKAGLNLNTQKTKIMATSPITS